MGNTIEIVDYREPRFTKAPALLQGVGLGDPDRRDPALEELRPKRLAG